MSHPVASQQPTARYHPHLWLQKVRVELQNSAIGQGEIGQESAGQSICLDLRLYSPGQGMMLQILAQSNKETVGLEAGGWWLVASGWWLVAGS